MLPAIFVVFSLWSIVCVWSFDWVIGSIIAGGSWLSFFFLVALVAATAQQDNGSRMPASISRLSNSTSIIAGAAWSRAAALASIRVMACSAERRASARLRWVVSEAALTQPVTSPKLFFSGVIWSRTLNRSPLRRQKRNSIPVVGDFARHLGIPTILMGFGLPDDGLHSPNEKYRLENYYTGIMAIAHFFEKYGAQPV